jgi:hypothetical protein
MSLMPEYREQLTTAAAGRRRRGPLSRGMSAVPALVVVLVALAIAAGAMLALRHHSSGGASTGPTSTAADAPPPVGAARKQLRSQLGVLRTGASQAPRAIIPTIFRPIPHRPKGSYNFDHTRLDRPLVRSVRLGRYEVGVLPTTWRPPGRSERSEGLIASFYGPGVDQLPPRLQRRDPIPQISSAIPPAAPSVIARHGLIVTSEVAPGVDRGAMIVPDGVAAIRLSAVRITRTRSIDPAAVPIVPATGAVHDNVAPLALTGLTVAHLGLSRVAVVHRQYMARPAVSRSCRYSFAIYGLPATARITWLNASDDPIARVATKLTLYVTSDHPVTSRPDVRACEAMKRARR